MDGLEHEAHTMFDVQVSTVGIYSVAAVIVGMLLLLSAWSEWPDLLEMVELEARHLGRRFDRWTVLVSLYHYGYDIQKLKLDQFEKVELFGLKLPTMQTRTKPWFIFYNRSLDWWTLREMARLHEQCRQTEIVCITSCIAAAFCFGMVYRGLF